MKPSKDEQEKIISEAFELLKDHYDENWDTFNALEDSIGKMAKINIPKAAEMLEYLIRKHPDGLIELDDADETDFSMMTYEIREVAGEERAYQTVTYNEFLRKSLFGIGARVDETVIDSIGYFLACDNFELANELMTLIMENENKNNDNECNSLAYLIDEIINATNSWMEWKWVRGEEAIKLLSSWIEKIPDENERKEVSHKLENNFARYIRKQNK